VKKRRLALNPARFALGATVALAAAGCGQLNHNAELNDGPQTSGTVTGTALEQLLTKQGLSGAHVSCAKTLIVDVGTTSSCTLTNAGPKTAVQFRFKDSSGTIDPSSVRAS
jgi:hypothetical protein